MTNNPVLTLVLTAHHTRYLAEALTSVAAQTTADFDLVCCADSTASADVLEFFKEYAPYVRCRRRHVMSVNGGTAGRVRNVGFATARTGWVAYLDGDDLLRPDAIELVLSAIGGTDADILSTGMTRIGQDGNPERWPQSESYLPPKWIYWIDPDTVGHRTFFNQFLAIRRELWSAHPFYEATNGEDIDFMLHQLLSGRFRKLAVPAYGYRDTPGSFSKREYEGGDICTVRYRAGYYQQLFQRCYGPSLAGNFSDAPEPSCRCRG